MTTPRLQNGLESWISSLPRIEARGWVFLEIAKLLALLGTCDRKQVGAIITRGGRCVSWGFNGAPPGAPHCDYNGHGWGDVDDTGGIPIKTLSEAATERLSQYWRQELLPWDWQGAIDLLASRFGCRNATHAEANALSFAARSGISTEAGTLYVTVSPCDVCARLLIAAGIRRVIYLEEYRDRRGIEILTGAGIDCSLGSHSDRSAGA